MSSRTQLNVIKYSLITFFSTVISLENANAEYVNISLDGSYNKTLSQYSTTYRKSWGLSLGIPITKILEIEFGHTFSDDKTVYNSDYRTLLESKGVFLPSTEISSKQQVQDYSANAALGIPLKYIRPSLFGGILQRKVCTETPFEDEGCSAQKTTWNAGLSLQTYITQSLRLKMSYRLSPSTTTSPGKRQFDELVSAGISWGI
jgi:opacity protein-like surface antigen